jgi:hypothetical protein
MRTVMETYPPNEYPKLYVSSIDKYKKFQNKFSAFNNILLIMGFSILSAMSMWAYLTGKEISQMIPWAYFMLQMVPLIMLEVSEFKSLKAMRVSNTNTTKKATIQPRKLFDFVSPKLLGFALVILLIAFTIVFYRYGFSEKFYSNIGIILATNLFFAGLIYWNIYGTKMDPYQANEDRIKVLKVTVTSMTYVSIAVSIFLSVQMLINMFEWDFLEKSIMSIYCQLIVWASVGSRLKQLKIENIDFDVYKSQESDTKKLSTQKTDLI